MAYQNVQGRAKGLPIIVIMALICCSRDGASGEAPGVIPTAEQVVALVQATRSQYQSYEVEQRGEVHEYRDGTRTTEPIRSGSSVWRMSGDRSYSRDVVQLLGRDGKQQTNRWAIAVTPNWSKRLVESTAQPFPEGMVEPGEQLASQMDYNVARIMWKPPGDPWSRITNENTTVERDSEGNLALTLKPDNSKVVVKVTVSPAYGFLPVRTSWDPGNKNPAITCESSDFRQVQGGLWLPFRYVWRRAATEAVYVVDRASVNIDLRDEDLDFAFPSGTRVIDNVANARYIVGDDTSLTVGRGGDKSVTDSRPSRLPTQDDLIASRPASDAALETAALRAKQEMTPIRSVPLLGAWGKLCLGLIIVVGLLIGFRVLRQKAKRQKTSEQR